MNTKIVLRKDTYNFRCPIILPGDHYISKLIIKNLPASRAHSHRAQLASLASLSAPRARDSIVALRAT